MYHMFTQESHVSASYGLYYSIFRTKFNISFGSPRSDPCGTCDALETKLKAADLQGAESIRRDLKLHQRRAESFYALMRTIKQRCQSSDDTLSISFDFMQNLPVPNMSTT